MRVLLVASPAEDGLTRPIWGTGGWRPPEEREALDWLTFLRLLGWEVDVTTPAGLAAGGVGAGTTAIVVACDPTALDREAVGRVADACHRQDLLVVLRAATQDSAAAALGAARGATTLGTVRRVEYAARGEGPWLGTNGFPGSALALGPDAAPAGTSDGVPVVARRAVAGSAVVTLGFHPSAARDQDPATSNLLLAMMAMGAPGPVAWLDLTGTVVLRMDDPGGSQNVHNRGWLHEELGEGTWASIGEELVRRDASMSVAYVAGWVDDGDRGRGTLLVAGEPVARLPGAVHPSPDVVYESRHVRHDYQGEFRALRRLHDAGIVTIEVHGYTHMHPDRRRWAAASDRYDAVGWYRELGPDAEAYLEATGAPHPVEEGHRAIRGRFASEPSTLVCPGDEWTEGALLVALDLGLDLVSSYYLALRHGDQLCWTTHVCAPYLDEPEERWFRNGLPLVGYLHDRDIALGGTSWLGRALDAWSDVGARLFTDLRWLASALATRVCTETTPETVTVTLASRAGPPPQSVELGVFDGGRSSRLIDVVTPPGVTAAVRSRTLPC